MSLHALVFSGIPLLAVLGNLFLFLTLLSARKSKLIYSFMGLLFAFILWTVGSYFMRMELIPGVRFWWDVSIAGIFAVPISFYLFMFYFTNQKGYIIKDIWVGISVVTIVLAVMGVFVAEPSMTLVNGEKAFSFHTYWPAAFAAAYAVALLLSIIPMVRNGLKKDGLPVSQFTPLLLGMCFLIAGITVNMIPALGYPPSDTLGCALNSVCMYYALYRKRLFRLTQLTSRGSTFLISAVISAAAILPVFDQLNAFVDNNLPQLARYRVFLIAVFFTLAVLLIFNIINYLAKKLFIEKKQQQNADVFAKALSSLQAPSNTCYGN